MVIDLSTATKRRENYHFLTKHNDNYAIWHRPTKQSLLNEFGWRFYLYVYFIICIKPKCLQWFLLLLLYGLDKLFFDISNKKRRRRVPSFFNCFITFDRPFMMTDKQNAIAVSIFQSEHCPWNTGSTVLITLFRHDLRLLINKMQDCMSMNSITYLIISLIQCVR